MRSLPGAAQRGSPTPPPATTQNDFAEAIQRSELDTWAYTKEVDNPELQGLARIRGHLDVMAQQLSALGDIEEAHKAEKNVVLEKLEHARVELFTAIDAAMPRINHEKAIVQAALEFVELPGDRERLRSPGLAYKTAAGQADVSAKLPRRSPHSVADSAPRSLNFTDVDSSGGEEAGSVDYDDDDDYDDFDDYGEVPESGWVVVSFLAAILGVGLHANRKHLGMQMRKWRDEGLEALKHHNNRATQRRANPIATRKPPRFQHKQQRQQGQQGQQRLRHHSSIAHHRVSNYELERLDKRDTGVISVTTSERAQSDGAEVEETPPVTSRHSSPARQRPTSSPSSQPPSAYASSLPSSPPRSPPRPPSPQRIIMISNGSVNHRSWRWRPHVLLGRG